MILFYDVCWEQWKILSIISHLNEFQLGEILIYLFIYFFLRKNKNILFLDKISYFVYFFSII